MSPSVASDWADEDIKALIRGRSSYGYRRAVLRRLPEWFEDYNKHGPHKALGMQSPRAFRRRAAA